MLGRVCSIVATATAPSRRRFSSSLVAAAAAAVNGHADAADAAPPTLGPPPKPVRVERLLANLGYGTRQECAALIRRGALTFAASGMAARIGQHAVPTELLLQGEALDPAPPLLVVLHKPVGYVVTAPHDETVRDPTIYELLPPRYGQRRPLLSAIGRLDKDTSGLLLLTDCGQLLHSIQSPAKGAAAGHACG